MKIEMSSTEIQCIFMGAYDLCKPVTINGQLFMVESYSESHTSHLPFHPSLVTKTLELKMALSEKSPQQLSAEESVKKAEDALKAAKEVLNQLKEVA